MADNANMGAAKAAKNDEFYTQWSDIENEMQAYLEYNADVFRGKTVLLPCDDPGASNFTKYFALNFEKFGLEKLISTSCAPRFTPANEKLGRVYVLERGDAVKEDGRLDKEDLKWDYLEGDGDFRSDEVTKLRDEADIVITNPPFSLFREFMAWLVEGDVEFAVIGNMNAVTYKEIFPLIKENKVWLGCGNNMWFEVPAIYPENKNEKFTKEGSRIIPVYSKWFTNIQHGRKNEPLKLMTMDDNLRYNKRIMGSLNSYKNYDNYDAIEVPFVSGIPSGYEGVMGVPLSFLDKYNPEQFEILGSQRWGKSQELLDVYTGDVVPPENDKKTLINGKETYDRIFIRHRNPGRKEPQLLSRSRGGRSSLRCKRELSHIL